MNRQDDFETWHELDFEGQCTHVDLVGSVDGDVNARELINVP